MVKHYSLIMFSRELALGSEDVQHQSVTALWNYISVRKNIVPKGKEHKLKEAFAEFFTGNIEIYRQYADAAGVLFQPEIYRGNLTGTERRHIKCMGFQVDRLQAVL